MTNNEASSARQGARGIRVLALAPLLLALAACSGHIHYRGPDVAPPPAAKRPVAYITNPELKREMKILQESQLYRLSANADAPDQITLQPLLHHGGCGNGLLGLFVTLGIVPVSIPDDYTVSYTLHDSSGTRNLSYTLRLEYTVSVWETFRIFSDADEELGHALRAQAITVGPDAPPFHFTEQNRQQP